MKRGPSSLHLAEGTTAALLIRLHPRCTVALINAVIRTSSRISKMGDCSQVHTLRVKKTGPFFIWAQLSQKLSDFNNSFTVADRHYVHKRIIEFITLPIVCCCTTLKNATAYTSSQKNCWINLQCMRWFHCCYKAQNSGVISGKTVMTVLLMLASVMFWLTESPRELLLHPLSKWIYVTVTW